MKRKLKLQTETIRVLTETKLGQIQAGYYPTETRIASGCAVSKTCAC
jgi:hypothetical protein